MGFEKEASEALPFVNPIVPLPAKVDTSGWLFFLLQAKIDTIDINSIGRTLLIKTYMV
jgi:hypothetical protein